MHPIHQNTVDIIEAVCHNGKVNISAPCQDCSGAKSSDQQVSVFYTKAKQVGMV